MQISEKYEFEFCGENFNRLLTFAMSKNAMLKISQRKLSHIATKLLKSRKFSPSKAFRYTVCKPHFTN